MPEVNGRVVLYRCPGCARPLRRVADVSDGEFHPRWFGEERERLGDWVCVGCPRYTNGAADRYFWSHMMPHPPGTPHEVILRDIRENLANEAASAKRCSEFPSWAACAVAYLLGRLDALEGRESVVPGADALSGPSAGDGEG